MLPNKQAAHIFGFCLVLPPLLDLILMGKGTIEDSFTKHLPFSLLAKTLENKVLKRDPQIILGFFDPDPVLLGQQGGGAKD